MMDDKTIIATEYSFSSAHFLPFVPDTHKCKRMHGHNYVLQVKVRGDLRLGMVIDFFDLDFIVEPLVKTIDHRCLNDIPGLDNPTAENIAAWFASQIAREMGREITCRVWETPQCYAEVTRLPVG